MGNLAARPTSDPDVVNVAAVCARVASLCASCAWRAANERSLLHAAAARDARRADEDSAALRDLLPTPVASAIVTLATHASWYASNTRRLVLCHASSDLVRVAGARNKLEAVVGRPLADALCSLALHAAWHAANARSLLWADSARDAAAFESFAALLPALLRDASAQLSEQLEREGRGSAAISGASSPIREPTGSPATRDSSPRTPGAIAELMARREANALTHAPPASPDAASQHRLARLRGEGVAAVPRSPLRTRSSSSSPSKGSAAAAEAAPAERCSPPLLRRGSSVLLRGGGVLGPITAAWRELRPATARWGQLPCEAFARAVYATTTLFEPLGSAVAFVAADLKGNADKLRAYAAAAAAARDGADAVTDAAPPTLEQLCDADLLRHGASPPQALQMAEGTTACALTWLCRFLKMLEVLVAELLRDAAAEVCECILAGYNASLAPHHPWVTRRLVRAGVGAAPSRADFLARLGTPDAEVAAAQMRALLEHFSPALRGAIALLVERGIEKTY